MRRSNIAGILLVSPALIVFILFKLWPIVWGTVLTFHSWDGFSDMTYVGFQNYRRMLTQDQFFSQVIGNTLMFAVGIIVGNIVLSLMLALLVDRRLRGSQIFRTIYFMPAIMSFVMVGLLWAWIYNPEFGLLNSFFSAIGLHSFRRNWLADPATALVSIIAIDIWKWSGWHMVVYLAGLQTISVDITDAATVDGASGIRRFRYITWPLLWPYTLMNITLVAIGAFNTFDLVYVTTRGGPLYTTHVMLTYVNLVAFKFHEVGYAATLTYFLFFAVFVVSLTNMVIWRRRQKSTNVA